MVWHKFLHHGKAPGWVPQITAINWLVIPVRMDGAVIKVSSIT